MNHLPKIVLALCVVVVIALASCRTISEWLGMFGGAAAASPAGPVASGAGAIVGQQIGSRVADALGAPKEMSIEEWSKLVKDLNDQLGGAKTALAGSEESLVGALKRLHEVQERKWYSWIPWQAYALVIAYLVLRNRQHVFPLVADVFLASGLGGKLKAFFARLLAILGVPGMTSEKADRISQLARPERWRRKLPPPITGSPTTRSPHPGAPSTT